MNSDRDGDRAPGNGVQQRHSERVRQYYEQTTEKSYLEGWARDVQGFHFGLADETTTSHAESLENTNAYLAERAGIQRSSRVLDAGCGVGGSAIWLAKNFGCEVVGVTLVTRQVEIARQLAGEHGVDALVRFEQADMVSTPFSDAHFDVVWNLESMCHVISLDTYLSEVRRVLKDGGRFVCIDECRTERTVPELEQRIVSGWALAPMRLPGEVVAGLERAGFLGAEHVDLTQRAMLSAKAMFAMASRTLLKLRAEKVFLGKDDPVYSGHVDAALAMVEGMESGQTTLSHFVATRPHRARVTDQ